MSDAARARAHRAMVPRTVVRSGADGVIVRWDVMMPESPCVSYHVRRPDGHRGVFPTLAEANTFLTGQHCPLLDLYADAS